MKIVYHILGTFNSGGMERVLCNKANWLVDQAKYDVSVITTDQKGRLPFFTFSPEIRHYDLDINYTDNNGLGFIKKTVSYLQKQRLHKARLTALLIQMKADVVISMFGPEIGFLWQIKDGSRKIVEIHFSKYFRLQQARRGPWHLVDKWRSIQDQRHIRKYDKFVVLTQEDQTYWGDYPNITVIPNASTLCAVSRSALDQKHVISVGRLTYQKGYDMLIDAWATVHLRHPGWSLTIVGDGEELAQRKQQIEHLGLGSTITLMPPTSDIVREYLSSSIFAMSSRYEGLPMVLLEAMACGVPTVSFACKCGPQDIIIDGESGLLIAPGNIDKLADGICKLIENDDLRSRMGANAAAFVRTNFAEDKIMARWVELFSKLTEK